MPLKIPFVPAEELLQGQRPSDQDFMMALSVMKDQGRLQDLTAETEHPNYTFEDLRPFGTTEDVMNSAAGREVEGDRAEPLPPPQKDQSRF